MRKKKLFRMLAFAASTVLAFSLLTGCKGNSQTEASGETVMEETAEESSLEVSKDEGSEGTRVVSLKGPTSLGLLNMMEEAGPDEFNFTIAADPGEAAAMLATGKADIALLPANVASTVFKNTEGKVKVLNINTLGVVSLVQSGTPIGSMKELEGHTIYAAGKGATPDLALQYLLAQNEVSVDKVTIEYKSEAAEVLAAMNENPDAFGLLPQPFVTVAMTQNEELQIAFDLTEEWTKVQGESGSALVTGVTLVRTEFLEENEEAVIQFTIMQKESTEKAASDLEGTAQLAEKYDIVKAPVARKAIPKCNITYIDGEEMREKLGGYLEILLEQQPEAIGGQLPGDEFYYVK